MRQSLTQDGAHPHSPTGNPLLLLSRLALRGRAALVCNMVTLQDHTGPVAASYHHKSFTGRQLSPLGRSHSTTSVLAQHHHSSFPLRNEDTHRPTPDTQSRVQTARSLDCRHKLPNPSHTTLQRDSMKLTWKPWCLQGE